MTWSKAKKRAAAATAFAALVALALPLTCCGVVARFAGAWKHAPEHMERGLSAPARALLDAAFSGLEPARILDYHAHALGLGAGGTGAWVNPRMKSWYHLRDRLRFEVYSSAGGISDPETADADYTARLAALARGLRGGRVALLAFDYNYLPSGGRSLELSEFHVPDEMVFEIAEDPRHGGVFEPVISVHPYRADAIEALGNGSEGLECEKEGRIGLKQG